MHQTLSGHFSLRTSRETGPMSGGSFSCPSSSNFDLRAGPRPEGLLLLRVPRSKDFPLTILHHEISFVMSSNELITLMKPSSARPAVKPHTGALNSMKLAKKKKKGSVFFQHLPLPRGCATLRSTPQIHQSDEQLSPQSFHIWLTHGTSQDTALDWFRSHEGHEQFIAMTWQSYMRSDHMGRKYLRGVGRAG